MTTIYAKDKHNQVYVFSNNEELELYSAVKLTEITESEAIACSEIAMTDDDKIKINTDFLSSEIRRASDAIEILDDAIEFGVATDDEIHKHTELRKYRLLLSRVPNQETWPLDPIWPACPEFFRSKE